jgi:PAS domain S-box-containing protein
MPMLITDPRLNDNPIVFANDAFLHMTGYARDEVMSRNCRLLQGPDTDPDAIARIREAVANRKDIAIDVLNYRKDGTPFWNALYMSPVVDEAGELLFFFASQVDVSERMAAEQAVRQENLRIEQAVTQRTRQLNKALNEQTELVHEIDHRVKNNLQLILALIIMETRAAAQSGQDAAGLRALQRRVEALASVHQKLYRQSANAGFDLAEFLQEIAARGAVSDLFALQKGSIDTAPVSILYAAPISLIASELLHIASLQQAKDTDVGLKLRLTPLGEQAFRVCLDADGAVDLQPFVSRSSREFIDLLASQVRATVNWPRDGHANSICIDLPSDHVEGQGAR